jgi:threonine dehydrogenase-like Zn-dependent dehydrogenase
MRQLTLEQAGRISWQEVPEPDLRDDGQALVRPLAVATCDLDLTIARGNSPFPAPIALGHEGVAEVVEVGRAVRSVKVGDRVVVPFQISCGTCDRCLRGGTDACERVPPLSMYGFGAAGGDWGGLLSDLVRVPFADAMLVPVPEGLDATAVASASDNIPDGWRLVAPFLAERPGADVLILGGGTRSISLYALSIPFALGAGRVDYVDTDPGRLAVASDLGARVLEADPERHAYGIVGDGSASADGLKLALGATEPGGHCTHAGVIFGPEVPLNMLALYTVGVHLHIGRAAARPVIPALLSMTANGRLDPARVTDRIVPWDEAGTAIVEDHTKLVFAR